MPATQLEVVDARRHRLRHIKPFAAGSGFTSGQTLLGRTYGFQELPISQLPTSRDFAEGTWTGRLGDAGEMETKFPNKEASDGKPWRDRFSTFGHLEFLEIYRDDVLEHVDVILKVAPDQQGVAVSGQDGWFLLRDAYERNWVCVQAPRDVIERASYVWCMTLGDEFTELNLSKWTAGHTGTGSVTAAAGGVLLKTSGASSAFLRSKPLQVPTNGRWRMIASFVVLKLKETTSIQLILKSSGASIGFYLDIFPEESQGSFTVPTVLGGHVFNIKLPNEFQVGPHSLQLESDGRFVRGYIDGYFIGEAPAVVPAEVTAEFKIGSGPGETEALIQEFLLRQAQPFLMRGSEKGDYVLPGGVQTYPYGGLTGRYYNDLDLQELPEYWLLCFSQERSLNRLVQYQDRTDATIGVLGGSIEAPPFPGASGQFWSCRWFGSVYLKLSAGNYTFKIGLGLTTGVRLWVGKTQFGAQIIDSWEDGTGRNLEVVVNAAALGGKDGWYPIVVEFFTAKEGATSDYIWLAFSAPASYTDPGGTAITAGFIGVPSTSLSPLGCVDQHFQGQSHFNMAKEIAENFGLQMQCEPRQLESGEFPGQLVPKARVGRDTDEILESDSIASRSPIINYKNTVDATDQATSLYGLGSGLPNGQNGQISAEEFSIPTIEESLFDLQGYLDAADINSPSLLAARVASQLALQTEPWQNVEGSPLARDRLADSFPLTGALAAFRWRPGDGVRIYLPDVNIQDVSPRQILQVTRQFGPTGRYGTQMGFRQRALDRVSQLTKLIRHATQPQRNYQRQMMPLPCTQLRESIGPGEEGAAWSLVPLLRSDVVIQALVLLVNNNNGQPLHLIVNGIDQTLALGGPWVKLPVAVNIAGVLTPEHTVGPGRNGAAYVRLKNAGGTTTFAEAVPYVIVLR